MEMDIANDIKIVEWLNNIDAKESTRKGYIRFMEIYCECVTKTPSELIQESIKELKQGLLPAERNVRGYISKFKSCMNQKGYAPKSFHYGIAAIRSFYKAFDIPLPASAVKSKKPLPLKENNHFISRDDVKKLVVNAKNLREKAIILCMVTSGMARHEIINLKVKDISFDTEGIGIISVRREKSQTDYTTFISPEAKQALKVYWEERDRIASKKDSITVDELRKKKFAHAEEVVRQRKELAKKLKAMPNSFAFVTYETGDKLSDSYFAEIFHTLGNELGYDDGGGFVKTRSHSLRKYFASILEDNGFPKPKIDFMMGHTVPDIDKAYFNRDPSKLKELYKTFLPYLTFEKTIEIRSLDTKDSERLEELSKENERLKNNLESKGTETQDLKKRLDGLEKQQQNEIENLKAMIIAMSKAEKQKA